MDLADQLAGSPLFKGVERPDREALIKVMRRQSYPKGAILFHKGDPGDSMYIILSGRVRIFSPQADGSELPIRSLSEMFGEFAMLDQEPRSTSAAAEVDLEVLVLHRDDFNGFLRERPLVGLSMMRNLVERVRYTTNFLQRVIDVTQQLARGEYTDVAPVANADSDSETDAEIHKLVDALAQMVRAVQAREERLKHQPPAPSER
jgi:CRP-like cAMP-binding protein